MTHHFTLEYLKTVPLPKGKTQLTISDKKSTYLVARIGTRKRSWYCVKKIRGRKAGAKSIYIGNILLMGLEEARKISRRLAAICDEGKDPTNLVSTKRNVTVQEAWDHFCKYRSKAIQEQSFKNLEIRYRHYLSHLKDKKLFSVNGRMLADIVNNSKRKYTACRAVRLFNRLWVMIAGGLTKEEAWALPENPFSVMREKIIGPAQFKQLLKPGETAIIKRRDLGRYMAFLEDCIAKEPHSIYRSQCQIYLLCLHTGLRFAEAATLKWTSIDWEAQVLKIDRSQSKTMVEHIVHLSTYVRAFLQARMVEDDERIKTSPFVFPKVRRTDKPTTLCAQSFKRVSKFLEYRFTSHANRRSFFCFAIKTCRVDFVSAQKMMNHKTKGRSVAEQHYALLEEFEPDGLSKEFETVSRRLCKERDSYLAETTQKS